MGTAVEVEQLAEARPRLAPPAMPPARAPFREQAGALQGALDERVAQRHAMVAPGQVAEMAPIEAGVALAIEAQHALDLGQRHASGRGGAPPAIVTAALIAQAPAPEPPWAPAENLFGRRPRELATEGLQHDLLHFHRPLHDSGRIGHRRASSALSSATPRCPPERSHHLLSRAVRSRALYIP
jgi:hypothetical protein